MWNCYAEGILKENGGNTNQIYITVDGTFLAIRDKKTDTYLAIDAGVPRIDLKTLNGIKHYKLTEICSMHQYQM